MKAAGEPGPGRPSEHRGERRECRDSWGVHFFEFEALYVLFCFFFAVGSYLVWNYVRIVFTKKKKKREFIPRSSKLCL